MIRRRVNRHQNKDKKNNKHNDQDAVSEIDVADLVGESDADIDSSIVAEDHLKAKAPKVQDEPETADMAEHMSMKGNRRKKGKANKKNDKSDTDDSLPGGKANKKKKKDGKHGADMSMRASGKADKTTVTKMAPLSEPAHIVAMNGKADKMTETEIAPLAEPAHMEPMEPADSGNRRKKGQGKAHMEPSDPADGENRRKRGKGKAKKTTEGNSTESNSTESKSGKASPIVAQQGEKFGWLLEEVEEYELETAGKARKMMR